MITNLLFRVENDSTTSLESDSSINYRNASNINARKIDPLEDQPKKDRRPRLSSLGSRQSNRPNESLESIVE